MASEVPRSFDIIGNVAIIKLPKSLLPHKQTIAKAIMQTNRHIRTVLLQTSAIDGNLRLRKLAWIEGRRTWKTVYKENKVVFEVDLRRVYFSPRLSFERMRIASQVKPGEVVVNMFAGVGCFSIVIAKNSQVERVFSIDVNPDAWGCAKRNVSLNGVEDLVVVLLGDATKIVPSVLTGVADRVLMPLPLLADQSLKAAIEGLKPDGGIVHYYTHLHVRKSENPVSLAWSRIQSRLHDDGISATLKEGRRVRSIGPRKYQVVLDIQIHG